jgi:hypothetical protein
VHTKTEKAPRRRDLFWSCARLVIARAIVIATPPIAAPGDEGLSAQPPATRHSRISDDDDGSGQSRNHAPQSGGARTRLWHSTNRPRSPCSERPPSRPSEFRLPDLRNEFPVHRDGKERRRYPATNPERQSAVAHMSATTCNLARAQSITVSRAPIHTERLALGYRHRYL